MLSVIPTPVYAATGVQGAVGSGPVSEEFFDRAKKDAEAFVGGIVSRAEAQGIKVRGEITENVPSVVDEAGLKIEPRGGHIPVVHISAKTGQNIDLLS